MFVNTKSKWRFLTHSIIYGIQTDSLLILHKAPNYPAKIKRKYFKNKTFRHLPSRYTDIVEVLIAYILTQYLKHIVFIQKNPQHVPTTT